MAVLAAARDAALRARERVWSNGTCVGAVACLMFPFTSACVKLLHGRVPILEICLIRSAIAWAASLALGAATRVSPLWGRPANARYLVGRGVAGTLAVTCNYTAVALLPLGDAAGLNMLKPCAVAAAGWLLLGEPLGAAGAAGLAVSVAGVVVLVHPPALFGGHAESGRQRVLGTAAALGSSAFAAGVAFSIRRIGRSEAALTVALAFHSCTLVMSSPTLALSWPAPAVLPAPRDWGLLVAIALTSFAAQLLLTRSFQLLPAGRASAMGFTSVIYSHILGSAIFGERLTLTSAAGSAIILGGVLLTTMRDKGAAAAPHDGKAGAGPPPQQQQQQELAPAGSAGEGAGAAAGGRQQERRDAGGDEEGEGDEEAPLLERRRWEWPSFTMGSFSGGGGPGGGACTPAAAPVTPLSPLGAPPPPPPPRAAVAPSLPAAGSQRHEPSVGAGGARPQPAAQPQAAAGAAEVEMGGRALPP